MASASSGIESFVAGSVYDPAANVRRADSNQTVIVAGIAAAVLLVIIALKK